MGDAVLALTCDGSEIVLPLVLGTSLIPILFRDDTRLQSGCLVSSGLHPGYCSSVFIGRLPETSAFLVAHTSAIARLA